MISVVEVDLAGAVSWERLTETTEAFSGASLAVAVLGSGERVVVKRLAPEGDWLTRATGGGLRMRRLWERGVLERVSESVDHAVMAVQRFGGADVVVMRDVSAELFSNDLVLDEVSVDRVLAGLGGLHRRFEGERDDGWCRIGDRYTMFAPAAVAGDVGPNPHPVASRIVEGWEMFVEAVDDNVADAVLAVHADPGRVEGVLGAAPATLLHGDAKPENLGLSDRGLVAIDWGELTGVGPAAVDVGWFAVKSVARCGLNADQMFAAYERVTGASFSPDVVDAVMVGSLAQMGFRFALGATGQGLDDPVVAATQLKWWRRRVDAGLSRLGW